MSLTLRNKTLFPALAGNLFDTGRLFGSNILNPDLDLFDLNGGSMILPDVNIVENEKDYQIELAAPGLERKDFKVEVENGMLTISAEKQKSEKENGKHYRRREFSYSSFSRSFELPDNLVTDKIDAKYDKGVLLVTLPKKESTVSKPAKQIEVA